MLVSSGSILKPAPAVEMKTAQWLARQADFVAVEEAAVVVVQAVAVPSFQWQLAVLVAKEEEVLVLGDERPGDALDQGCPALLRPRPVRLAGTTAALRSHFRLVYCHGSALSSDRCGLVSPRLLIGVLSRMQLRRFRLFRALYRRCFFFFPFRFFSCSDFFSPFDDAGGGEARGRSTPAVTVTRKSFPSQRSGSDQWKVKTTSPPAANFSVGRSAT